ncbi:MAG: hypothetical protein IIA45_14645 [Bacteroidetes bacterium]|nr:hypothetical protein [Bacteroidota bacterium]
MNKETLTKEEQELIDKSIQAWREGKEGDVDEIQKLVEKVLAEFPDKVEEYKKGKEGLLGFFVGQVMKLSGNKSDPKIVNKLILKMLKSN